MMWGFVIPVWILIAAAGIKAQLGCLACDKTNEEQDESQCFWAKKSVKTLLPVSLLLFSIWLGIMHAGDQQLFYLFVLSVILCFIFGPVLFVCHTNCHLNTCKKWFKPTCFGKLYSLCPEDSGKIIYKENIVEKIVYVEKSPTPSKKKEKSPEPVKKATEQPTAKPPPTNYPPPRAQDYSGATHTQAQQFYSWLTDPNSNIAASNDILFRPHH